jgi:hypothetical protein
MCSQRVWGVVLIVIVASACDSRSSVPSAPSTVPQAVAPTSTFTLAGVINEALEGVQVRIGPQHAMTDGNGYYSIPGITAGEIWATKLGYRTEKRNVTLSTDTRLDMRLVPLDKYSLSGVVSELTPTGLVPIEGALVTGSFDYPVTTDKNGLFSIPGGLYESDDYIYGIYVIKEGYQTYTRYLTLSEDTRLDVQLVRR